MRVFRSLLKALFTSPGELSGPTGVSLAAWYRGLAKRVKLGIHCLKYPARPRKDCISPAVVGGRSPLRAWILSGVMARWVGVINSPRYVTEGEAIWAFLMETRYPLVKRKLRRVVVSLRHWLREGEHRRRSSTYCKRVEGFSWHSRRSFAKAWPKRWGLSLKPWGKTVQVSCWAELVRGSSQVKANKK